MKFLHQQILARRLLIKHTHQNIDYSYTRIWNDTLKEKMFWGLRSQSKLYGSWYNIQNAFWLGVLRILLMNRWISTKFGIYIVYIDIDILE